MSSFSLDLNNMINFDQFLTDLVTWKKSLDQSKMEHEHTFYDLFQHFVITCINKVRDVVHKFGLELALRD